MGLPSFAEGSPLLERAFVFAAESYRSASADDDMGHALDVAWLLNQAGHSETVIAAGLLHDVVEDTAAGRADVEARVDSEVANLVSALTEDESIVGYIERKAALRQSVLASGRDAAAIFAADKLSSVSTALANQTKWPQQKFDHYRKSVDSLEATYPDLPLMGDLRARLDTYERSVDGHTPS